LFLCFRAAGARIPKVAGFYHQPPEERLRNVVGIICAVLNIFASSSAL
jgi:hypothetical protein